MTQDEANRLRFESEAQAVGILATSGITEPKRGDFDDKVAYYKAEDNYWREHKKCVELVLSKRAAKMVGI